MKRFSAWLPTVLMVLAGAALLWFGPIPQPPGYHAFADARTFAGIPRAFDVLSNLGFALVGAWGLAGTIGRGGPRLFGAAWPGYALFFAALILTACGSAFYHLAPDNTRLVWDRIPIALASAGLLAGVRAETRSDGRALAVTVALAVAAVASVLWWYFSEAAGAGDLRPYLLMQLAPLLAVPLWQTEARAPRGERLAIAAAIVVYALARVAEANDRALFEAVGWISGHTAKHLLATCAAALIVERLVSRARLPARLKPAAP
jgi:hypothetical protein